MKKIVDNKSYIVMNALSKDSYDEKHIPNSIFCATHAPRSRAIHNKPCQTLIRNFSICIELYCKI